MSSYNDFFNVFTEGQLLLDVSRAAII